MEALQYHNRIMSVITKLAHSISTRNKGKGMRNANFKLETKLYVFSGPIIPCPTDPALPEEQLWSVQVASLLINLNFANKYKFSHELNWHYTAFI